ncbi:MAG: dethiobiotin synthase [Pseudomonadales bacterium]|nr:dethiobiotin synthase [Halioglobus sp.]MCP5128541.1 dethiobiotin synthase [Pseudomonadales bacterium]
MSKSWFVTGTDTGVGKTAVSCALLAAARRAGLRTAAIKPVAAGCDEANHNDDALQLMDWMTESLDYEQVNPVALRAAIAPHIAAQREGRSLQASRLAGLCRGVMLGGAQFVLIEGAGGWRVPINGRETLADLAIQLQVGVILVVGMRLGCINHALLSAEAIARDGLQLAGWVANQPGEVMPCYGENLETLQRLLPAPLLGEIPAMSPFDADLASETLSLEALLS